MACDQNCVRQENFLGIVQDEQGSEKQDSKEGSGSVSLSGSSSGEKTPEVQVRVACWPQACFSVGL